MLITLKSNIITLLIITCYVLRVILELQKLSDLFLVLSFSKNIYRKLLSLLVYFLTGVYCQQFEDLRRNK